jgi:hypothetical protein
MLIVPLKGDKATTVDGDEFTVLEYTNYKTDPAVYIDVPPGQNSILYFQDIAEINDVKVEFNKSSKLFTALGIVKRKYNLPQSKDVLTVENPGSPEDAQPIDVEVKTLKLHSRAIGLSKGLAVLDDDHKVYVLSDILNIERANGSEHFDRKKFLKYYRDYTGA